LREAAEQFLRGLDAAHPTLAAIEPFRAIEVFPAFREAGTQGKGCRLPLGVDLTARGVKPRVTITDRLLVGEPKANLSEFVAWVDGGGGNNLPAPEFLKFLVQNTPEHQAPALTARRGKQDRGSGQRLGPRPGGMGQLPYKLKGNLKRLLKDFKAGAVPPDTVGTFVAVVARLVHFCGGDPGEVLRACLGRWRERGVDTAFSDRVSCAEGEL